MAYTRRRILTVAGAAGAVLAAGVGLVETRVLPGRALLHGAIGLTGPDGVVPSSRPGPTISEEFRSDARAGRVVRWQAAYPPGSRGNERLPVVVALHPRGADHRFAFAELGLDRFLTTVVRSGAAPLVVASVDGGDTFWHRRADGDDPMRMVRTELLPRLARRGLLTKRYGLIGWSMGGFGVLLHAEQEPEEVAAVVAVSPALWRTYDDVPEGAFDGESDWSAHDVYAGAPILYDVPVRVDCGRDDPFVDATREFVAGLPQPPAGGFQPGAHTGGYWRRLVPDQLRFLARHLSGGDS